LSVQPSKPGRGRCGRRRARRSGALILAAALCVGGAPAGAVTGVRDTTPVISEVTVTPEEVVLPTADGRKASVEIQMHVLSSAGIDSVVAGLYAPSSGTGKAVRLGRVSGSATDGVWRAEAKLPSSSALGQWRLQAFAVDKAQRSSDANQIYAGFRVRTPTRLASFTVGWADDGSRVRVAAKLERRQSGQGWLGVADEDVVVEFRPPGATDFALADTTRTGADGSISVSPTSDATVGTWRLRYAGDEFSAPTGSPEVAVAPLPSPTANPTALPTDEPDTTSSAGPRRSAGPRPSGTPEPTATATHAPGDRSVAPRPSWNATPSTSVRPSVTGRPSANAAPSAPPTDPEAEPAFSAAPSSAANPARRLPDQPPEARSPAAAAPTGSGAGTSGRRPNR